VLFTRSDNSNADTGEWLGTTLVRSVEHNIEVANDYFQPDLTTLPAAKPVMLDSPDPTGNQP